MDLRRVDRAGGSPFLRRGQSERLRRGRRRRALRRAFFGALALVGCGVLLGAGYAGRHYAMNSPRFRLRWIGLTPTEHASAEDLRRAVDRYRGRNVFRLPLDRLESDLEQVRWVKDARVKRVLPDGVLCSIEERVPRALALIEGRVWLVDADAVAIDTYGEDTRTYSFPILTGVDISDPDRSKAQIGRGLALIAYLEEGHRGLLAEVSEIDLSRDDRLGVRLDGGGPEIRFNPTRFGTNLDNFLAMRDYLATHFGDGAYVDLRFRDRIALQPDVPEGR